MMPKGGGKAHLLARGSVGLFVCVSIAAFGACVVYEDHCVGVSCGDGEVCIDLAAGPRCVCDDFHEDSGNGCEPIEDEGGASG